MGHHLDTVLKPLVSISNEPGGCWLWLGKIHAASGYGHKQSGARTLLAHRWMYSIFHGHITESMVLDHLCRNRACVNPAHLQVVSQATNNRRGNNTKLTLEQAREIKAALPHLKWGDRRKLAAKYGVSAQLITDIKYGRAWAEV